MAGIYRNAQQPLSTPNTVDWSPVLQAFLLSSVSSLSERNLRKRAEAPLGHSLREAVSRHMRPLNAERAYVGVDVDKLIPIVHESPRLRDDHVIVFDVILGEAVLF
jgi:hypothetical protein